MKAARTDERDKTAGSDTHPAGEQAETHREGPPRVSHELDKQEEWDTAAKDRGFQKGDQGGYKGDYDHGKYEDRDFGFPKKEDAERNQGSRQATPSLAEGERKNKNG
ncbi:hypothetical protein [Bordetella flabilis]|uniref:Uncharacterized protein n=1 Tax=Bordetella flabilis TaxID=463014 RepID=A0A193GCY3_9BORD|nr:hypothetical protein [Bordetella flabilis]ANN77316.1 hypothetical protein BAU07_09575 [Bordetella flabilis]